MTASGAGAKVLTLTGTAPGVGVLLGSIPNNAAASRTHLTKIGTGTWVLGGTNSYQGITTLNGGVLSITNIANGGTVCNLGQADRGATNLVLGGGQLRFAAPAGSYSTDRGYTLTAATLSAFDITNPLTTLILLGTNTATTGGFVKNGPGTLTLAGTNYHSGVSAISNGTFNVTGVMTGLSPVVVYPAGRLSGSGRIAGAVTTFGLLAAGQDGAAGTTTTVGRLTLNPGGTLAFEFSAAPTNDTLVVTNTAGLTLTNAAGFYLYTEGTTNAFSTPGTYNLIQYSGALVGSATNLTVLNPEAGRTYAVGVSGGWVILAIGTTADQNVWNGGSMTDANWQTPANWTSGVAPGVNAALTFAGSTQLANTNDYPAGTRFSGLVFDATAGAFSLYGNALKLTGPVINNSAQPQAVNLPVTLNMGNRIFGGAGDIAVNAAIDDNSETNGLVKTGAGVLILAAANTFAGSVAVGEGAVNIRNSAALGATTGGVAVAANAALQLQGGIAVGAEALSLAGTGTAGDGALRNVQDTNSFAGLITLAAPTLIESDAGTLTLDVAAGNAITGTAQNLMFGGAGAIAVVDPIAIGAGTLTKNDGGLLTLAGVNTFTGAVTLAAGTLRATSSAQALGAGASALTINGGELQMATATGLAFLRNTVLANDATLVSDLPANGMGVTNTLGTLALGGQTLTVNAGASVTGGMAGVIFGATALSGDPILNVHSNGAALSSLTLGALNDGGVVRTVTKEGAGQLFLGTAAASMTNGTLARVLAGRLNVNNATALGPVPAVDVADGAVFSPGASLTVSTLTSTGAVLNTASVALNGAVALTIGDNTNNLSATFPGVITGVSGALTKSGNGTLTLTASNSYGGITRLNAGTLVAGHPGALGTNTTATALTLAGGTLDLAADSSINAYNTTLSGASTIVLDRATSGPGLAHTLGALATGANPLYLAVGGNANDGLGSLTFGAITLTSGALFDVPTNVDLTLGGLVGNSTFTKSGAGRLLLYGTTARTTAATTLNGGTLVIGGVPGATSDSLGSTGAINLNTGTVVFASDTSAKSHVINVGGDSRLVFDRATPGTGIVTTLNNPTFGPYQVEMTPGTNVTGGTNNLAFGTTTLTGNPTFNVFGNDAGVPMAVSMGGLADGGIPRIITKTGNGILSFGTAISSFVNGSLVRIVEGRLNSLVSPALGAVAMVDVADGAIFGSGGSQTIGALSNTNSPSGTASVVLVANTLTVGGTNNLSSEFSGVISGAGSLGKGGTGVFTLSGTNNTYTGFTSVGAGTLRIPSLANGGVPSPIGQSSASSTNLVLSGGTLQFTAPAGAYDTDRGFTLTAATTSTWDMVDAGASLTVSGPNTATTGGLIKNGAGSLTLGGTNLHTGATIVSNGTLKITGALAGLTPVAVMNGAALAGNGRIAGTVVQNAGATVAPGLDGSAGGSLSVGRLTLNAGSLLAFEFSAVPTNDTLVVTNSAGLTLGAAGVFLFQEGTNDAWTTPGVYNLIQFTGVYSGNLGALTVQNPDPSKLYSFGVEGNWITLTISDASIWDGGGADDNWTTGLNWTNDAAPAAGSGLVFDGASRLAPNNDFGDNTLFSGLVFGGSAEPFTVGGNAITLSGSVVNESANTQTVSLAITLAQGHRLFDAETQDLIIGGAIGEVTSGLGIVKSGPAALILTGANTYGGQTLIQDGSLQVGDGGATGNLGTNAIVNNGSLTFNRSGALSYGSVISGTGSVTVTGSGTITFQGAAAHSYTGVTAVKAGELQLGKTAAVNSVPGPLEIGDGLGGAGADTVKLLTANQILDTATVLINSSGRLNLNGFAEAFRSLGDLGAGGGSVTLGAGTVTLTNLAGSLSFSGVIEGAGGLTKAGAGTQILTGANIYAGATTVNGGALVVNAPGSLAAASAVSVNSSGTLAGDGAANGVVTVKSGATLAPGNTGTAGQALTVGSLVLSAGSTNAFEFLDATTFDSVAVNDLNGLTINGGDIYLYQQGTTNAWAPTDGLYNLVAFSGTLGGSGLTALTVKNPAAGKSYTFGVSNGVPSQLYVLISGADKVWTGAADGLWTADGNWNPSHPLENERLTFAGALVGNSNDNAEATRFAGIVFNSGASAFELVGNALRLHGDIVNNSTNVQTVNLPLALDSGTRLFNAAAGEIVLGALAAIGETNGSWGLVKSGSGILTLTGASTYSGLTTVNAGLLRVLNGSGSATGPGDVTLNSSGALSGTGIIGGQVYNKAGGLVAPGLTGTAGGVLTVGSLTLYAGGTNAFEFATGPDANDRIAVTDTAGLTIAGGDVTLTAEGTATAWTNDGVYTLVTFEGALSGSPASLTVKNPAAGKSYSFGVLAGSPNQLRVSIGSSTKIWSGASPDDGNWLTESNWTGGIPAAYDVLTFAGNGGNWLTSNINSNTAGTVFGGLTFNAGASPFRLNGNAVNLFGNLASYSLNTQTINLPLALDSGVRTFNVASGTVVAAGSIGEANGTGSLVKNGAGGLTLSAANTFSGGVTLNVGTLNLAHPDALGAGAFVINGGTVDNASGANLVLAGESTCAWNSNFTFKGSTNLDLGSGGVALNNNVTLTTTANKLTVGGVISGPGRLTKAGSGYSPTLALAESNTFTGGFTLSGGAVVATALADGGQPSSIGASDNSAANFTLSAGLFTYAGNSVAIDRDLNMTASVLVEVLNPGTTLTLNGNQSNGSGGLFSQGQGKIVLNGTNFWIGPCQMTGGYTAQGGRITQGGGTLVVNGLARGSSIQSFVGSILGGTGTVSVSGNVLFAGSSLAPGLDGQAGGPLSITTAQLVLTNNSTAVYEFNATTNDTILVTGNVGIFPISRVSLVEQGTTNTWMANGVYKLIQYSGSILGSVNNLTVLNPLPDTLYTFFTEDGWIKVRIMGASGATWDGEGSDDNWSTITNWNPDAALSPYSGITFAGTNRLNPNNDLVGFTNGAIVFSDSPAPAGSFTLTGNAVGLGGHVINYSALPQTLALPLVLTYGSRAFNAASNDLTVSGTIGDGGAGYGITKIGAYPLVLSGANDYAGLTIVSNGVLNAQHASALGSTATGTLVVSGATLQLQGGIIIGDEALTVSGLGVASNGALRNMQDENAFGGAITLGGAARINSDAGTLTLNSASAVTGAFALTIGGAGTTVVATAINTGAGALTKDGAGTLVLANTNAFTGAITISDGTLAYGCNDPLGGNAITIGGSNAVLDIGGYNDTVGTISITAGAISGSGSLALGVLDLRNGAGVPDVYCSAVLTGTGRVVKSGSGYRAFLTATNSTYTGRTEPSGGGILSVAYLADGGQPSSIGAATADEANIQLHGQLEYTGPSVAMDRSMVIAPNCRILGMRGWMGQTDQDEGSILVANPDTTLTLNGVLNSLTNPVGTASGVAYFFKGGPGTLELAAANRYVGYTIVNEGRLKVTGSIATTNDYWTTTSPVSVRSNATISGTGSVGPGIRLYAFGAVAPGADASAGGFLTAGGLTLSADSKAVFKFSSAPTNDTIVLVGSDNLTLNGGSVYLYEEGTTNSWTTDGTYNLIQYAGAILGGGPGLLSVGNPAPDKGYVFALKDGWVTVTIGGGSMWDGGGADDNWLTATNWTLDAAPSADDLLVFSGTVRPTPVNDYLAGTRFSGLSFDAAADPFVLTGNAVKLAGNMINTSTNLQTIGLAVELDSNDRLISSVNGDTLVTGAISDGGNGFGIVKSGSRNLTLSGANTYGGDTVIAQGQLTLGAGEVIPDGAGKGLVDLVSGTVLELNGFSETLNGLAGSGRISNSTGSATLTIGAGDMSSTSAVWLTDGAGTLSLTKVGTGVLALGALNTYSGNTLVSNGTLRVSNASGSATGSGNVDVRAGASLDGTGILQGGLVTLDAAAGIEPGADGPGTLTVEDLAWADSAVYTCDVTDLAGAAGQGYGNLVANGIVGPVAPGNKLIISLNSLGQTLDIPTNASVVIRVLTAPAMSDLNPGDYTLETNSFLAAGDWALTNFGNTLVAYCRLAVQTNVWIGSGSWTTATNWSSGNIPQPGDTVLFDGTSSGNCAAGFNSINGPLGSMTLDTGYTGTVTLAKGAASGSMVLSLTGDLAVNSGALVLQGDTTAIGAGTLDNPYGVGYTIKAASVTVASGASLNADNSGFGVLQGPAKAIVNRSQYGVWASGAKGASHGGYGGTYSSYSNPIPRYGSPGAPTELGSGGTLPGGGALHLKVPGAVTIDGTLSASCVGPTTLMVTDGSAGGAGGSIWIEGGTLSGAGLIRANGQTDTNSAGGGGGRIDISSTTNNFAGIFEVLPGMGNYSTAANLYTHTMRRGYPGSILFPQSAGTGLTLDSFIPSFTNVTFGNSLTFGTMTVTSGVSVRVQAYNDETVVTVGTLTVQSNGNFVSLGDYYAVNADAGGTPHNPYGHGMTIVASNILIEAGGSINSDNEGFPSAKYSYVSSLYGASGTGPGGAPTFNVTAASYGGQPGGNTATVAYSDISKRAPPYGPAVGPTALGSSGNQHGHVGGGAIKLIVSDTITVNGALSADAVQAATGSEGSSGGSVWIASGTLEGSGRITANGAPVLTGGGGGGGGRIDIGGVVNNFTGLLVARGGTGGNVFNRGQAGSLILPASAGSSGATLANFAPYGTSFILGNSMTFGDCVVSNGVVLTLDCNEGENTFTFNSLTIQSGGTVRCMGNLLAINAAAGGVSNSIRGLGVTLAVSNLTIEAGGSLNADGKGFDSSTLASARLSNAGGYGGYAGGVAGWVYGTISNVAILGSGTTTAGGGAIRIVASGAVSVDGALTADGLATTNAGGSGGSLWIDCDSLLGSGVISANGSGATNKVGGGGGRLHVVCNALGTPNPFDAKKLQAFGGGALPALKGGAGTVLLQKRGSTEPLGTLMIVNDTVSSASAMELPYADLALDRVLMEMSYVYQPTSFILSVTTVFSNRNVFVASPGSTVSLVGSGDAIVYGSAAFDGFRIDGAGKTVRFEAGQTNSAARELSLNSATLLSTQPGSWWYLNCLPGATQSVQCVRVQDGNAGGGVPIVVQDWRSRDWGNNVNWIFPPPAGTLIIIR
jgi:autotransporter-associated beta strand protein